VRTPCFPVSHLPRIVEVAAVLVVAEEEEEAAAGLIFEVWLIFRATLYEDDKAYKKECDERGYLEAVDRM
jgi:hypothetical protein